MLFYLPVTPTVRSSSEPPLRLQSNGFFFSWHKTISYSRSLYVAHLALNSHRLARQQATTDYPTLDLMSGFVSALCRIAGRQNILTIGAIKHGNPGHTHVTLIAVFLLTHANIYYFNYQVILYASIFTPIILHYRGHYLILSTYAFYPTLPRQKTFQILGFRPSKSPLHKGFRSILSCTSP